MLQDDFAPTIGLVELPEHQLIDPDGIHYSSTSVGMPLISKQVLSSRTQLITQCPQRVKRSETGASHFCKSMKKG